MVQQNFQISLSQTKIFHHMDAIRISIDLPIDFSPDT